MTKPSLRAKTTKIELEHPTEGKCGWVLELHGFDSKVVRDKIKDIAALAAEKEAAAKDAGTAVTVRERMDADEWSNADIVAAAIAGWNDAFAEADPDIGPFSPAKATEMMRDPSISWVREQVEACLRKRANFFR
jgi:hypothetical protein